MNFGVALVDRRKLFRAGERISGRSPNPSVCVQRLSNSTGRNENWPLAGAASGGAPSAVRQIRPMLSI